MKSMFCCEALFYTVRLLLLVLGLHSTAVLAEMPEFNCKPYVNEESYFVCGDLTDNRRQFRFGCDLFCMLGGQWNGSALNLEKNALLNNFKRWCSITADKAQAVPNQLTYAKFALVMAVFTPACLRESLLLFSDIVTKDIYKSTDPAQMTESDLTFWFSFIVVGAGYAYNPERKEMRIDNLHVDIWKAYWQRLLISFIHEKIDCK